MTLLCLAWAAGAPMTWTLDNGVRIVFEPTDDGSGRAGAAWLAPVGSEDGPLGATAMALASLHTGTLTAGSPDPAAEWAARSTGTTIDGADPNAVHARWVSVVGAVPTPVVEAHRAGDALDVASDHLDAWAWLASDALVAPALRDLPGLRAAAVALAPAWTELDAVHAAPDRRIPITADALAALDGRTVSLQVDRLTDPRGLVVAVVGDIGAEQVHAAVDRAFARLAPRAGTAPSARVTWSGERRLHTIGDGPPRWEARLGDGPGADTLRAHLEAPLRAALAPSTTAFRIGADPDGLWISADLAPGVSPGTVEAAVDRVLQRQPTPDDIARAETLAALAAPDDRATRAVALATGDTTPLPTALARARARRTLHTHAATPDDPEVAALVAALGPMVGELIRLRLDRLAAIPPEELPATIEALQAERAAVAPPLAPAIDLLVERARRRLP